MLNLSEFVVSFFVIALISAFPEASISIFSALDGVPELGLGTLLGSNVADLTLVFGLTALMSSRGIHVRSEILKKDFVYLALLLFPLLLGMDGYLSRGNGVLLVLGGLSFFFTLSIESGMFHKKMDHLKKFSTVKSLVFLVTSAAVLIISSKYAVEYATAFARDIGIPSTLIGLTMISIGVCLPEFMFSLRAVKNDCDSLALGDVLGTVITDATIVLGLVAIIRPFRFDPLIIYVTGTAMFFAGLLAVIFISSDRVLTKKEGPACCFLHTLPYF